MLFIPNLFISPTSPNDNEIHCDLTSQNSELFTISHSLPLLYFLFTNKRWKMPRVNTSTRKPGLPTPPKKKKKFNFCCCNCCCMQEMRPEGGVVTCNCYASSFLFWILSISIFPFLSLKVWLAFKILNL